MKIRDVRRGDRVWIVDGVDVTEGVVHDVRGSGIHVHNGYSFVRWGDVFATRRAALTTALEIARAAVSRLEADLAGEDAGP